MNYELAKKLKDAGFPQKDFTPSDIESFANDGYDSAVTFPTLEELIEACAGNEGFRLYEQYTDNDGWWSAAGHSTSAQGSTPSEAVANLWLALNK